MDSSDSWIKVERKHRKSVLSSPYKKKSLLKSKDMKNDGLSSLRKAVSPQRGKSSQQTRHLTRSAAAALATVIEDAVNQSSVSAPATDCVVTTASSPPFVSAPAPVNHLVTTAPIVSAPRTTSPDMMAGPSTVQQADAPTRPVPAQRNSTTLIATPAGLLPQPPPGLGWPMDGRYPPRPVLPTCPPSVRWSTPTATSSSVAAQHDVRRTLSKPGVAQGPVFDPASDEEEAAAPLVEDISDPEPPQKESRAQRTVVYVFKASPVPVDRRDFDSVLAEIGADQVYACGPVGSNLRWEISTRTVTQARELAKHTFTSVGNQRAKVFLLKDPITLVKLRGMPYSVTDRQVTDWFASYGTVTDVQHDFDETYPHIKTLTRTVKMTNADRNRIPDLAKISVDGREVRVSCQVVGRPPMCFRCGNRGHMQSSCRRGACDMCGGDHYTTDCTAPASQTRDNPTPGELKLRKRQQNNKRTERQLPDKHKQHDSDNDNNTRTRETKDRKQKSKQTRKQELLAQAKNKSSNQLVECDSHTDTTQTNTDASLVKKSTESKTNTKQTQSAAAPQEAVVKHTNTHLTQNTQSHPQQSESTQLHTQPPQQTQQPEHKQQPEYTQPHTQQLEHTQSQQTHIQQHPPKQSQTTLPQQSPTPHQSTDLALYSDPYDNEYDNNDLYIDIDEPSLPSQITPGQRTYAGVTKGSWAEQSANLGADHSFDEWFDPTPT